MKLSKIILLCSLAFLLSNQCMGRSTDNSLFDAIMNHDSKKVVELIKNNKEIINTSYSYDQSEIYPLHMALYQGSTKIAAFLIKEGANIHIKDSAGYTPLEIATKKNNPKLINLLTKLIALCNSLYNAIINNEFEQVKKLIEGNKFIINIKNQEGSTPLHIAVQKGNIEMAKLLIDKGADINARDELGNASLHIAIKKGNTAIAKLLIEKKIFFFRQAANINIQNKEYFTPLHLAVEYDNIEIVKLLISKGANINAQSYLGYTPLYIAAQKGLNF